jgi:glycosyltransferase involved in cell wall biosynthesis
VAFVIHRLTGIPYSFTAHGSDLHRDKHMLREKVRESAFVAAISEYNRRIIVEHCDRRSAAKVRVVHCGVDTSVFEPVERTTANGRQPLKLLCIGTLHEVKGQTYLIEACRLLNEGGLAAECHLVGDGPDEFSLRRQAAAAGLAERVHFHGRCSRDEVVRFLHEATILVAPSVPTRDGRREGIPVVLMEALGSGVPAVASDLSGIPELVRDGQSGLLARPGDAASLADAIARLARDPELRARLGAEGRRIVLEEFDERKTAEELCRLFAGEGKK